MNKSAKQIYGIAMYDAVFKTVLADDEIRPSFFHAFIPGINITSSKRLDEHMNPLEELQLLRSLLNSEQSRDVVALLREVIGYKVVVQKEGFDIFKEHAKATEFLSNLVARFEELVEVFPEAQYKGRMDFVCQLDTGEYALVEAQIVKEDYWDKRALAYIAAFYGNQLRKSGTWDHIKRVIGVNILGGGKNQTRHWPDTPDEFIRHFMFEEQIHKSKGQRFIPDLQLFQYSIQNAKLNSELSQEQKDWVLFLKNGHHMSEQEMLESIQTQSVRKAFERAKFSGMSTFQLKSYEEEDVQYARIAGSLQEERQAGKVEGLVEGESIGLEKGEVIGEVKARLKTALNMLLKNKYDDNEIIECTGVTKEELDELKRDNDLT